MRWITVCLIVFAAIGNARSLEAQSPPPNDPARALFMAGRNYWDDGRWAEAERQFREALARYPKSDQADRTGFYLIETLMRMGRTKDALTEINKFPSSFPKSKWLTDVQEKRIRLTNQLPPEAAMPYSGFPGWVPFKPNGDPQVGLAQEVLRVVLRNDPERGIEISKERLKADPSDPVVLSNLSAIAESGSAAALPLLASIAKTSPSPKERADAVFWLGRSPKESGAVKVLADIARDDSDIMVRRAAIQSLAQRREPEAMKALDDFLKTVGTKQ